MGLKNKISELTLLYIFTKCAEFYYDFKQMIALICHMKWCKFQYTPNQRISRNNLNAKMNDVGY